TARARRAAPPETPGRPATTPRPGRGPPPGRGGCGSPDQLAAPVSFCVGSGSSGSARLGGGQVSETGRTFTGAGLSTVDIASASVISCESFGIHRLLSGGV